MEEQRGSPADRSFANGNMPPASMKSWPCAADWYAGGGDDRLLSHWAVM